MDEHWNRCDVCGQFIALKDFENDEAVRQLLTPDSHFTTEIYETYHRKCDEQR